MKECFFVPCRTEKYVKLYRRDFYFFIFLFFIFLFYFIYFCLTDIY